MGKAFWKVGELAKRTGLTIRALHHYDRKGLVTPSQNSESGHRLYTEGNIAKLQQVISLKHLGFGLEEIKGLMERGDYDPAEVLRIQKERLGATIVQQQQLYDRLGELHALIRKREHVSTEQFLKIIEVMNMKPSQYFTDEQLEKLKRQTESLGPDKMMEMANEWPELIAKVREKMESGTPVNDPEVAPLAVRWKELMNLFSGGDDEIINAAERFHGENPDNPIQHGMDRELYRYIKEAMSHI